MSSEILLECYNCKSDYPIQKQIDHLVETGEDIPLRIECSVCGGVTLTHISTVRKNERKKKINALLNNN